MEKFTEAIDSLRKVKVPTRNSLVYHACALAKTEQPEKATETLKQAITTMDMTVDRFVDSQEYKEQEKRKELLETLQAISV